MRHKSRKCPFFLCEQTVKGSKQDNRDKPEKDQRVLKTVISAPDSFPAIFLRYACFGIT